MDVDLNRTEKTSDAFLQVRLTTKSKRYAVPDVPYSLPDSTTPADLNALLNQILSENADDWTGVEFDFLADGELLQSSLQSYVRKHEISTEQVLVVEYIEHLPAPKPEHSIEHSDWVSAVDSLQDFILTGCYDNTVSLWSRTGQLLMRSDLHLAPIKSVACISASAEGGTFISASHDQTAALWSYEKHGNKYACVPRAFFRGHAGSVDGVSLSPDRQKFCSVSWDKMVKIWSLSDEVDEGVGSDGEPVDKKQKTDGKRITRVPVMTLSGHKEAASTCVWSGPSEIITASWDHSIKIWDVELGGMSRQLDGPKAFLSIAFSPLNRLLITGATDRLVRLYDPRSNGK